MKSDMHRTRSGAAATGWALILLVQVLITTLAGKEGALQCANLVYGGVHTSRCFSDEFLSTVQRKTSVPTERRFKSVKLDSDELFRYPFTVMTGEDTFMLTKTERDNLRHYLTSGGFLLASAGCSSKDWDLAFRREIKAVFKDVKEMELTPLPMDHPVFSAFYEIAELKLSHPAEEPRLEGLIHDGKVVLIYSGHGLNDTAHTEGCCCCGGNEISNALQVNVNILVYALLH
jgi:hypothetical protein